ncbi:N-acetyltransferase [Dysgonomonas sp. 216]|uniref:GNAT family N-acetyltransferase n=1 Tax=Dysgonomonas sp. 216 TaxID=2302934 RepID=UPI0013D67352|nr:GNAT family protein [Dysgonomonas sp. 216]NDW17854.1 N-acetyltransferase [Dysgonomonas sp. 216]
MMLNNNILNLRAVEPEDLDILYRWENNTNLWIHGNSISPYSKQTLRQYILDSQTSDIYQNKQLRLMIDLKSEGNKTIGAIDLYDLDIHNLRCGIGILLDKEYQKKGFAGIALDLVKLYAFSFLRLHQLYAYIIADNKASIRLFEKSGFDRCGIFKEWICATDDYKDVFIYQLIHKSDD